MAIELTPATQKLFLELVNDAPNWEGVPMFQGSKEERGNLTDLKKKGLLTTEQDDENRQVFWIYFTEAGKAFAKQLGIQL